MEVDCQCGLMVDFCVDGHSADSEDDEDDGPVAPTTDTIFIGN
jgi:hypothetical protein